jgi:hypothetical protein
MKFHVMKTDREEMTKWLQDRSYVPKEEKVADLEAPNESVAIARVNRGIVEGIYPHGSRAVEVIGG